MPKPEHMSGMEEAVEAKSEGVEPKESKRSLEEIGRERLYSALGRKADTGKKIGRGVSSIARRAWGGITRFGRGAREVGKGAGRAIERGASLAYAAPEMKNIAEKYVGDQYKDTKAAIGSTIKSGIELGANVAEATVSYVGAKGEALAGKAVDTYTGAAEKVTGAIKWGREQKKSVVDKWHAHQEAKAAAARVAQMEQLRSRHEEILQEYGSVQQAMEELQRQMQEASLRTEAAAA